MIVTVTPNPALDLTYTVEELSLGTTHRVQGVSRRGGGKGANVSSVLAALGEPTAAVLPCGGSTGDEVHEDLEARGVDTVPVRIEGSTRQTLAVVGSDGTTTNFSEPGPVISDDEWHALVGEIRQLARRATAVVVSGSLPPGIDAAQLGQLVATAREHCGLVVVDASGPSLEAAAEAGAHLLAPNREELLSCCPGTDLVSAGRRLIEKGATAVLVSLGAEGLLHITADEVHSQRAVEGIQGNTTGAGDAALAAFVRSKSRGANVPTSLNQAAAAGAAAVLDPLAGRITPRDFDRMLTRIHQLDPTDPTDLSGDIR